MENFDRPVATVCKPVPHVFCMDCIEGVLGDADDSRGSCPLCRQQIRYKDLRRAIIPSTLPEDNILVDLVQDVKFDFIFKSKLEALVRELQIIREKEPSAKSLVFSQFGSTLEWFQTELPKHGFKYETLKGSMTMQQRAKALKNFRTDPDTSVFLLSMKAGAVGINLTQASRVFLIEPALNPALDAQAIGRVHRLGQKRQVEVVRLVVENSIETRILRKNSHPVVGISKQESKISLEGGEENTGSSSTAMSASGDSTIQLSLAEENNSSALSSDIISNGHVMVGSLKSDKTMLKVEHFDELFGFKALEGRWRC